MSGQGENKIGGRHSHQKAMSRVRGGGSGAASAPPGLAGMTFERCPNLRCFIFCHLCFVIYCRGGQASRVRESETTTGHPDRAAAWVFINARWLSAAKESNHSLRRVVRGYLWRGWDWSRDTLFSALLLLPC